MQSLTDGFHSATNGNVGAIQSEINAIPEVPDRSRLRKVTLSISSTCHSMGL